MTTAMTPTPDRSVALKPLGSDVVNIAAVNAMAQVLLDRGEWSSKSLIVPYVKNPDMAGNDIVPSGTTYATVTDGSTAASFTLTLSVGDMVWLDASSSAAPGSGAYGFSLRWFDGTDELVDYYFNKGAAYVGSESLPFSLGCLYIATVAGSKTFSFQAKSDHVSLPVLGNGRFQARCIHVKLGAT